MKAEDRTPHESQEEEVQRQEVLDPRSAWQGDPVRLLARGERRESAAPKARAAPL